LLPIPCLAETSNQSINQDFVIMPPVIINDCAVAPTPESAVAAAPTTTSSIAPTSAIDYHKFSILLFSVQTIVVVVCLAVTTYPNVNVDININEFSIAEYYMFKDIMIMLLIGFGYLMTFLRQYGLSSVGFTLLLVVVSMQLNLLVEFFMTNAYNAMVDNDDNDGFSLPFAISMSSLIDAEFSAATLLISFGALIGNATPLQMVVLAVSQSVFYAFNKAVFVFGLIGAEDVGGTIAIHMFGAYFGLAASAALGPPKDVGAAVNASPNRVSDVLAMLGTTVLWVFWPSFVGATETANDETEMRCLINTIMALLGSTVAAFWASHWLGGGKLDPVHIANSTLAGGVAIGASGRLDIGPGGALMLGVVAGIVSVLGYVYSTPKLEKLGVYDTCGVNNLHGYPSLLGGLASVVAVALDSEADFLMDSVNGRLGGPLRQVCGVVATVAVSGISGYTTGLLIKTPAIKSKDDDTTPSYEDAVWWSADYLSAV
jgi:ammonium transporter Rh